MARSRSKLVSTTAVGLPAQAEGASSSSLGGEHITTDLAEFLRQNPTAGAKFWREIAIDLRRRLLQTNDVVRSYFEVNRALIENPTFREAYAMCNR